MICYFVVILQLLLFILPQFLRTSFIFFILSSKYKCVWDVALFVCAGSNSIYRLYLKEKLSHNTCLHISIDTRECPYMFTTPSPYSFCSSFSCHAKIYLYIFLILLYSCFYNSTKAVTSSSYLFINHRARPTTCFSTNPTILASILYYFSSTSYIPSDKAHLISTCIHICLCSNFTLQ